MQKNVNKVLDKTETEFASQEKSPLSSLTNGSALSELHSELSKWSHLLNINLLMPTHLNEDRIYLGLDDELIAPMQNVIKKYIEGTFLTVTYHVETFYGISFREEYNDIAIEMMNMYSKYIKLFY